MGLSASQARLLTLTARLSDLELRAQQISNSKMRLSSNSEGISKAYSDELAKEKLTFATTDSDGNKSYQDLTANSIINYNEASMDSQRRLQDSYGRTLVSESQAKNYQNSGGTLEKFLNAYGYTNYTSTELQSNYHNDFETQSLSSIAGSISTVNASISSAVGTTTQVGTTSVPQYSTQKVITSQAEQDYYTFCESLSNAYYDSSALSDLSSAMSVIITDIGSFNTLMQRYSKDVSEAGLYANAGAGDPTYTSYLRDIDAEEVNIIMQNSPSCTEDGQVVSGYIDVPTTTQVSTTTYSSTMTKDDMATALTKLKSEFGSLADTLVSGKVNSDVTAAKSALSALLGELGAGSSVPSDAARDIKSKLSSLDLTQLKKDLDDASLTNTGVASAIGDYTFDSSAVSYYTNLFNSMGAGKTNNFITAANSSLSSSDWLQTQITNGTLSLSKYNKTDSKFKSETISSDSGIVQESDDKQLAQAEANYQAKMAEVTAKDNKFDLQLNNINTEHSAVQSEVDSVKKVLSKNIDRSFKVFNA